MNFAQFCKYFPGVAKALDREQLAAIRFLEQRGRRFCIDFGYENAAAIVWGILEREPVQ